MKIDGVPYRTIWPRGDGRSIEIIDQTRLPHEFATVRLSTMEEAAHAIRAMRVRGTPLIGAAEVETVTVTPPGSAVANPAFDVTPARLVTGLITERGVATASREALLELFPERK